MNNLLPLGGFKWVENTYQFNKDFIENSNEDSDEAYFHEVDINIQKNCMNIIMIYYFYLKE